MIVAGQRGAIVDEVTVIMIETFLGIAAIVLAGTLMEAVTVGYPTAPVMAGGGAIAQAAGGADGLLGAGGSAAGVLASAVVIAADGAVLDVVPCGAGLLPDVGALRGLGRTAAIGGTGAGVVPSSLQTQLPQV